MEIAHVHTSLMRRSSYIQPLTPCITVSLGSSISHGAYFIPCDMIERVVIGQYLSWGSTGPETATRFALERISRSILATWKAHFLDQAVETSEHIPDLKNPEGVCQFISLCAYRELVNITSPLSYSQADLSQALPTKERLGFMAARTVSRALLDWFFHSFELVGSQDTLRAIYFRYLAGVVKCLLSQQAALNETEGISHDRVFQLVQETFKDREEFLKPFNSTEVSAGYGFPLLKGEIRRIPASQYTVAPIGQNGM